MKPGILSGVPAFPRPILHVQSTLPDLSEIAEPLRAALDNRCLTNHGPFVRRLEERLEEYLGVHCVCVASGTTALQLAAGCLLGPGARALVPAYTFPATVQAFAVQGGRAVLADVDEGSWCLAPEALAPDVLGGVDCVVPVNVYGTPPRAEELEALAAASGCRVIYDSAHGLGSERRGRKVGGFGDAEAVSLHATKLVACGEGGLIATRDESLAREARQRLNFGLGEDRVVRSPGGINGKMAEIPAILGLWGMDRLESWIGHRAGLAGLYRERLGGVPGLGFQRTDPGDRSNHVNFAVRVSERFGLSRDGLLAALAADNVLGRAMLSPDLSAHPGLRDAVSPGRRPRTAEAVAGSVLCLPISSHQEEDEVSRICDCICRIHEAAGRIREKIGERP
ncbi:MAG: DegT/DnrJ/EryC1/StrS family aminotransferase [Acidobacteriota bacterium]